MSEPVKPYIIVVGIDYAETSDLALERSLELAGAHERSEVHAINVAHLVSPGDEFTFLSPGVSAAMSIEEAEATLERHLEARLESFRKGRAAGEGIPARVVPHLRFEAPAHEIAQLAADLEADLVVVGTHGRRGLKRLLIGSVAEAVVRLAPCPVLVIRPRELVNLPRILPPCPDCVKVRAATAGRELWCEQHRERHGQRRGGERAGVPRVFVL